MFPQFEKYSLYSKSKGTITSVNTKAMKKGKKVKIEVSVGELFDKISILRLKKHNIADEEKLTNIIKELNILDAIALEINPKYKECELYRELNSINGGLWLIEERKRSFEREKDFGSDFVWFARQVYIQNDSRYEVKKAINIKYGSDIIEEKSYEKY